MNLKANTKSARLESLIKRGARGIYWRCRQSIFKMRTLIAIVLLTPTYCFCQRSYDERLSKNLERLKEMHYYDTDVIMLPDSIEFEGALLYWKSFNFYYKGDVVRFKYCLYEAKRDTKGKMPTNSIDDWQMIEGPHPYFFFRDTARVEDLKMLLNSDNAYIRIYSFVALSGRAYDGLFRVVIDNLKDTTKLLQMSYDVGTEVYPAEIMMLWGMSRFTKREKKQIKGLILSHYPHLKKCIQHAYW